MPQTEEEIDFLKHSRQDHVVVVMCRPIRFAQGNIVIPRCDRHDLSVQVNMLRRQLFDDFVDVLLGTSLHCQPRRSTIDLHEVMIVKEADQSLGREVKCGFVSWGRPAVSH